jgi:hypothetical protein
MVEFPDGQLVGDCLAGIGDNGGIGGEVPRGGGFRR